jgi:alpha-tubulin suppressor-like RCC1 family protein
MPTRVLGSALAGVLAILALPLTSASGADGAVQHWGSYAGKHAAPLPTTVSNLVDVVAIDASNTSSYVLESNGTVWAFGENGRAQLGDGSNASSNKEAVQVDFPAGVKIVAIGEAQNSGFAIDSTGQGWAWGQAGGGQLCLGKSEAKIATPEKIAGMTEALAVQGGEHHVLWLLKNGTMESCGSNSNGQLGVSQKTKKSDVPVKIPGLSNVLEISAGEKSSCARTSAGSVYDWGADYNGQAANGLEEPGVYAPYLVALPGAASQISCGGNLPENGHTMVLVKGVPYGWGADLFGQVGDGKTVNKLKPVIATEAQSLGLTHVVASGAYSLGLTAKGNVYAWGSDAGEALGTGTGASSLTPRLVDSGVSEISATAQNSLVR